MLITNTITMAIDRQQMPPVIDAVQGDANSRAIKIKLTNGGQPWTVPSDASCIIRFGKPDKTGGAYDTLEDGTNAIEIGDNYLQIILAKQVISFPGTVFLQVEMVSNGAYLSTFSIVVNVQEDPSVGTLESDDYVNLSSYVSDEIRRILSDEGVGGAGTFWVHATLDYEAGTAEVVESVEEIYAAHEANMNCCMRATVTNPVTDAKQILILQTAEKSPTANGTHYRIAFHQLSSYEERSEGTGEWVTRAVLDEVVVSKFDDEIQNVCFRTRVLTDDDQAGSGNVDLSEYAKKSDLPKTLPNPNALTINGQAYDGSEAVSVDTTPLYIKITRDETTGEWAADQSYAKIAYEFSLGRTLFCILYGTLLPMLSIDDGFDFSITLAFGDMFVTYFVAIGQDDSVAVETADTTSLPNPNAMNVNGVSYDGTEPMDFTDTINGMIDAKVAEIPSGDTEAVPDYVRTEAERLASVVQARQNENTVSAILSSDYHLPQPSHAYYAQILESITHAGQAMSILRGRLSLDFEAKLGDLIWDATETPAEALKSFQVVHSLASEGNVLDRYEGNGNHDHLQSNDAPLTDAQVYANIGIYNKGCVRDDANRVGGYCYKDYDEFMLRVVLLNTSEANDGSFAMSSKQIEWLSEALNVPVEEGWGILILSHHPLDWGGSSTAVMKKIKAASGIIANLHGHVHTFTQDVITGTEIPRLAIPNVCFYRNNEYGQNGKAENSEGIEFGTTTTYSKTPKSATDTSFCVLTLDRATGKLYLDRYGAGIDREETVPTWGKLGYTNLVPTSEAADSTEPYNAVGYKNGVYLSSNGGDSADEACVATGYIPYTWATQNSIYVKGAEVSSASHVRIYGYSAKGSAPVGSATCSGPNLSTYFTVEELGTNYYRLTPLSSNATGVVYLRLSLIGTGENLIVTVNEPIE